MISVGPAGCANRQPTPLAASCNLCYCRMLTPGLGTGTAQAVANAMGRARKRLTGQCLTSPEPRGFHDSQQHQQQEEEEALHSKLQLGQA